MNFPTSGPTAERKSSTLVEEMTRVAVIAVEVTALQDGRKVFPSRRASCKVRLVESLREYEGLPCKEMFAVPCHL